MLRLSGLALPLDHEPDALPSAIRARLGVDDLRGFTVYRRGNDARRRNAIQLVYTVDVDLAEVVREADGFGQCLVDREGPRNCAADLRDLQRVRDARAVEIALVVHEDLCLVEQAAEGVRVDDAIAIALELGAISGRRLGKAPSAASFIDLGV